VKKPEWEAMAKMIGQGKPLPADLGCNGEWIVEDFFFLYHGETRFGRTARFEITVGARYNGNECLGFHAAQIALMFKVDEATIVAANKSGDLEFLGTAKVAPAYGGNTATAYGFRLGDRKDYLTVEMSERAGLG
jgi:hypothetical protein